ncbi:MAG: VUT family protein [Phycisphaerales bacterium]|nr:MAG: VUT family protein [Phycisphaerales bacterium]
MAGRHLEPILDAVHAPSWLHERRERVFLVFAGIFLGSMTMLNILGITRFIHVGPAALAVGVLPYPLTFLCTDFISEFYGRRRANFVVWLGFGLNVLVLAFLWLGHQMPAIDESARPGWLPEGSWNPPPWQTLEFARPVLLPFGGEVSRIDLFEIIFRCTRSAVAASMMAYLAAQFCDVFLFHFWKRLTRGRHLWLRNNGSTLISQLVDSTAVIFITFWASFQAGQRTLGSMFVLVASSYVFKAAVALLDTIPFYLGVKWLGRYLQIDPTLEHDADAEAGSSP